MTKLAPTKPDTFDALLMIWGSPKLLSDDLGCPYVTAQQMMRRRSVGIEHWPKLIERAAQRGIALTNDDLVAMSLKRKAAA